MFQLIINIQNVQYVCSPHVSENGSLASLCDLLNAASFLQCKKYNLMVHIYYF